MRPVNKSFLYIDCDGDKHILRPILYVFNVNQKISRCGLCFFSQYHHTINRKNCFEPYAMERVGSCGCDKGAFYFKLIKSKQYAPTIKQ